MKHNITITKGTPKDIPAFLQYFRTSIPHHFPQYSQNLIGFLVDVDYGPQWLKDQFKKGNKRILLARSGTQIVGYLLYTLPNAGVAYGDWIGVDKEYRKQGVASQLLAAWEKDAFADGAHNLHLWTYDYNVAFYTNRGFTNGGVMRKGWAGEDGYFMYKLLREPEERNYLKRYLQKIKKG